MRLTFDRADAALFVVACAVVLLYAGAVGGFPLDDSWIHQTYARNLATTGEWAFTPGIPSAASTSPLYTLLLAAGYRLGLPFMPWTHALGAAALAAAGLVGRRLAAGLAPDVRGVGLAVGLAVVLSWHLIWAAASGMETMLFSLWTLALAWLGLRAAQAPASGLLFGLAGGLATVTRPEGVLFTGLLALAPLLASRRAGWAGITRWAAGAVAGFAIVVTPYLWLNWRLTGGLLPDTAAAKQAEYAPLLALPYAERVWRMLLPLLAGAQVLLLPGGVVFIARQARRPWTPVTLAALAPLAASLALVLLYAARLPAAYQHGRYVIPALPALVVCGVVGTAWLLRDARRSAVGRVLSRALAASVALALPAFAVGIGLSAYRQDVRIIDEEMVAAAHWIAGNVPPDELLAVHDIGAVGYFAPRPILDLAGLVSPEVVPLMGDAPGLWGLLEQRGAAWLMAFPDQIPGGSTADARLCPVYSTDGPTARVLGQANMAVYRLDWTGRCE